MSKYFISAMFSTCVLAITGCAATVTFIDQTNGNAYTGKTGGTGHGEGDITATIEDRIYTGTWFYSAVGGGYSIGSAMGFSGGQTAFATGTAIGISAQGHGLINIKGSESDYIRCVFDFNGFSNKGIGECQRNDGRLFDVRIKR